eukprot:gene26079-32608_t
MRTGISEGTIDDGTDVPVGGFGLIVGVADGEVPAISAGNSA